MKKLFQILLPSVVAALLMVGSVNAANVFPATLNVWEEGDIIESDWANELEDKLGVDGSTVTTSIDYLIKNASSSLGSVYNITHSDGKFIVSDGTIFVGESGATARTSLGLGNVENTALSTWVGSGNITTIGTISSGDISAIETDAVWIASSSDYFTLAAWNATDTDALSEGSTNLYYTNARARAAISETITGISYNSGTGVLSLTANYIIPLSASTTDWQTAFLWGDWSGEGFIDNTVSELSSLVSIGTIATGTWEGDPIDDAFIASSTEYLVDTDTTYSATGTLLDLTDEVFSINEGTMTTGKFCLFDGTDLVCNSDAGATLTQEQVEDFAGEMIATSTGTHTRLTIIYQDATGDMDFLVEGDLSLYDNTTSSFATSGQVWDISENTNLTAGDHITLTDDDLDIDDDFVLNTGDTITGALITQGTSTQATTTITYLTISDSINFDTITDKIYFNVSSYLSYNVWRTALVGGMRILNVSDHENAYVGFGVGSSENIDLIINYEGKVGIGTTTPSQELDLIGDLELEMTISDNTGVIYKGADGFIHNFQHPTGDTAVPVGRNTFIGINAGNFTMGSTASTTSHGSNNTAVGYDAFYSNITGYNNSAMGYGALYNNTTGYDNVAMGYDALVANTTGISNTAIGSLALWINHEGNRNTAIGGYSLFANTGNNNIGIGYQAGQNITSGSNNIIIGYSVDAPSATADNQLNIGDAIYGDLSTGNIGIGTDSPNAPLEVKGAKPGGNVGGFQSGMFHITGAGTAEFSNSVITGHNAYATNTQLWYLGSLSSNNNDIGLLNRQNAAIHFYTNNAFRMAIDAAGNIGIGTTSPSQLLTVGDNDQFTVTDAGAIDAASLTLDTELADSEVSNTLTVTGYMQDEDINTFNELQAWVSDEVLLASSSIDTFDELNAIVADKTLINEEDAVQFDSTVGITGALTIDTDLTGILRADSGVVSTTTAGAGYTDLTEFVDQTAWRVFYSNADGDVVELALGSDGEYLKSTGASAAPEWDTPSGEGTVSSVAMSVPTGLDIAGSPITATGTLALTLTAGYNIPLDASTTEWATAHGWGDHSVESYLTTVAYGDLTGNPSDVITAGTGLAWDTDTLNWTAQLSDLSDVGDTTPTDTYALMADGDSWESRALVEADISDLGTYLTGNEEITISGDATGSGTTSIAVSLAADSVADNEIDYTNVTLADFTNDGDYATTGHIWLDANIASSTEYLADEDTQLNEEEVQDFAFTNSLDGTETNISVAYNDGTGNIDFQVTDAWWNALTDMVLTDNYIYVGDGSNDPVGVAMSNDCSIASNGAITCDHDALDNFDANEHFLQSAITEVGTLATGVFEGTPIDDAYIASSTEYLLNTTYLGGTNLTLDGTTFNVDDAFVLTGGDEMTGNLTFDAGTVTIAGIQNQNLLDKSAVETVAGEWDFSATTTVEAMFIVNDGSSSGTSTVQVGSTTTQNVGCLKLFDTDRAGWSYCTTLDGTMSCSTDPCE